MTNSLLTILPYTLNILLIIILTLFIYTVIGNELFVYLRPNSELNEHDQNYHSFGNALFALVKFSMMESPISQIINAAQQNAPNFVCHSVTTYSEYLQYGKNGCGSGFKSYTFFLTFHLIYAIILLPTLMAVIVEAYSQIRREEEAVVNKFQLQEIKEEWKNYDPDATGFISYRDFWMFTAKLMKIYKMDKFQLLSTETKQSFLKLLAIPIYEN